MLLLYVLLHVLMCSQTNAMAEACGSSELARAAAAGACALMHEYTHLPASFDLTSSTQMRPDTACILEKSACSKGTGTVDDSHPLRVSDNSAGGKHVIEGCTIL